MTTRCESVGHICSLCQPPSAGDVELESLAGVALCWDGLEGTVCVCCPDSCGGYRGLQAGRLAVPIAVGGCEPAGWLSP